MSSKQLPRNGYVNGCNKPTVNNSTGNDARSENNSYFASLIRGCDPRAQTCRGKLQSRRCKLNQEINKELMLRNGAVNLFKATNNKKLRETVALELSFVNSNLQLLKEQLAELNSSVDVYQSNSTNSGVPMIPLGLKETKEIDFQEAFKDFIQEHYGEDGGKYEDLIKDFMDLRQAMRTPMRDQSGISLLFEYYNHLHYIERRFFSSDRNLGIYFEWFDSLTGVPSCQRTIAFEKASVLFNIAALYTQIGARQDRAKSSGIDSAIDKYLRAAGMFRYIQEHFSHAPSMDLSADTLDMLVSLMLAQARECLFEKLILNGSEKKIELYLDIAQEAAQVAEVYYSVHKCISEPPVKDYVPYSWISLVLVKAKHYQALSHFYVALGLLDHVGEIEGHVLDTLQCIQIPEEKSLTIDINRLPDDQKVLGKAHLREALFLHEESIRVHRMCRELRKVDTLLDTLKIAHARSSNKYDEIEEEDDFQEVFDPPGIQASTKCQLTLTPPDFSQYKVKDLFHSLGPLAVFSSKNHWTSPRIVKLRKRSDESFGFSVRGDSPVIIAGVDRASLAEVGGMKEGDFIVGIGDIDAKWCHHEDVVALIREAGCQLTLLIVTPINRNFLKTSSPCHSPASTASSSGVSSVSSARPINQSPTGSMCSTKSKDSTWRLSWNPFRHHGSKEKMTGPVFEYGSLGRR